MSEITTGRPAAAVLVCTYDRPAMLNTLLERLEVLRDSQPSSPFRCVVVDDHPGGSAKAVVERRRASGLDVTYVHAGGRNISLARNAAAAAAIDDEWWFLIDDDCLPADDWMTTLVEAQEATGADIVCGAVHYEVAPGAPAWLTTQGFLDVNHYDHGDEPEFGAFANALVRAAWWRDHPEVRFREEFGTRGGEDLVFMIDARRAGAVVRWTARSFVDEAVPAARSTFRYQLRRRLWTGNVNAIIDLECGVRSWPRQFARTGLKALHLVRDVVFGLISRHRLQGHRRLGQAAFVVGMCLALVGVDMNHR